MCTGLEIAAIAGAVASAGGAIYAGAQSEKAADASAAQADADADAERGQAAVEADKIRKAAKAQQSAAVAALAASGVDVSTGTAEQIQTDIGQRGEEDALTMILNGGRRARSLNRGAQLDRMAGDQAMTAGVISGVSSVAASARGWKSTGARTTSPYYDPQGSP